MAEKKDAERISSRWGVAVEPGFTAIPDVLIRYSGMLDISGTEFLVLANLLAAWWSAEEQPFPRTSVIARRMNVTPRTVERALLNLEKKGLIKKMPSREGPRGLAVRPYDLSGLKARLEKLALRDLERRRVELKTKMGGASDPTHSLI